MAEFLHHCHMLYLILAFDHVLYHLIYKTFSQEPNDASDDAIREMTILPQLDNPGIVKIYDAWKESNEFVYIQMEKCDNNLLKILEIKSQAFDRESDAAISSLEYFMSWHILKEIAEALLYLHVPEQCQGQSERKPIIHRDLHPGNVLINYTAKFIKLCDFDQAKEFAGSSGNTNSKGAIMWMAPETSTRASGRSADKLKYNTKIDVYSLALVALVTFGFDITKIFGQFMYVTILN